MKSAFYALFLCPKNCNNRINDANKTTFAVIRRFDRILISYEVTLP